MNKSVLCVLLLSYSCIAQATTFVYESDDCDSISDVKKHIIIEVDTSEVKDPNPKHGIAIFKNAQGISFFENPIFDHSLTPDTCGGSNEGSQQILLGGPGGKKFTMTQIKLFAPYDKPPYDKQCGLYKLGILIQEPRCAIIFKQQ